MRTKKYNVSLDMTTRNFTTGQIYNSGDISFTNSAYMIHFQMELPEIKYSSIKTVKVRFRQYNNSTANAYLTTSTETGMHTPDTGVLVKLVNEDGVDYREVDLTNHYITKNNKKYFAIICEEGEIKLYNDSSSYKPDLIIEYIDDGESTINQKYIEGYCGNAIKYNVNVRSGRPTFTKSLINNPTTVIPVNLGMYYDPLNGSLSTAQMPKGWNLSYNQRVYFENFEYKFIDESGLVHIFEQATNADNVYFDISGSGLILIESVNEFEITDGYDNYLYFEKENDGFLSKIKTVLNNNQFELIMVRNEITHALESVTERIVIDGVETINQSIISLLYKTDNTIEVMSYEDLKVVLTKNNNEELSTLKEEDNRIYTYAYFEDMLSAITTDNGEITNIAYNERKKVSNITDCVNNVNNIVNQIEIEYKHLTTIITNYFGIKMGYTFDSDGLLIGEYEVTGNKYSNTKYLDKTEEVVKLSSSKSDQYISFNDLSIGGETTLGQTLVNSNNLEMEEEAIYSLSFNYSFEYPAVGGFQTSYIAIKDGNTTLALKNLDGSRISDTLCTIEFKGLASRLPIIEVYNLNQNNSILNIKNIKITKLDLVMKYPCTNYKVNSELAFELEEDTYYPFSHLGFRYNTDQIVVGNMYFEDLVENQKNYYSNPSSQYVWFNKKKGLLVGVSNVLLYKSGSYIELSNFKCGTFTKKKDKVYYNYELLQPQSDTTNYMSTKVSGVIIDGVEKILNKSYENKACQIVRFEDEKQIAYTYSYDQYGNLIEEVISNTNNSKCITKKYVYDKMMLIKEKTYINGHESIIEYVMNNTGRIEKVIYPDGNEDTYEYCEDTTNKLKKIYRMVNSQINCNELTYFKDKIINYKGINTGLSVEYDNYNMIYKFKNVDKTLFTIDRTIDTTGINETIAYGTIDSYYVKNNYDEYGNLVVIQDSNDNITYNDVIKYFYADDEATNITVASPTDSSLSKNKDSKLKKVIDNRINNTKTLYYDDTGKLIKEINSDGTYNMSNIDFSYDDNDRLNKINYNNLREEEVMYENLYTNEISGYKTSVVYHHNFNFLTSYSNVFYDRDYLNRIIKETITIDSRILTREYTYLDNGNEATNLIKTIKLYNNQTLVETLNYEYDDMYRVTRVYNPNYTVDTTYVYDSLGRLVRENNKELNKSVLMTYDVNGNITSKKIEEYTLNELTANPILFTYSSTYSDIISSYNGETVTVSDTGNITNISNTTYSWTKWNKLSKVTKNSNEYVDFTYDGSGNRIEKISYNNGTKSTHKYTLYKDRILSENIKGGTHEGIINYIYLGNEVVGFVYKGKKYIYQKNLQGDIINIYDNTNTLVASYKYDAWGNHTITTDVNSIGTINPLRYRGYYYDVETGLFMVGHRYYNPEWGRWIQPDDIEYLDPTNINGLNLYAYCNNDPVNMYDPTGHFAISALIIGLVVGVAATGLKDYLNDGKIFNGDVSGWEYFGSAVSGILGGAAGQAGNILVRVAGAIGSEIIGGLISENVNYSWNSLKNNIITGLVSAGIGEGLSIVGKRIAKSIYSRGFANASKNGQKELSRFLKTSGKFKVTNKSALNVLENVDNFISGFERIKDFSGNFYSFTVGAFGNIIEW